MLFETTSKVERLRLVKTGPLVAALAFCCALPVLAQDLDEQSAVEAETPVLVSGPFSLATSTQAGSGSGRMPLVLNTTGNGFDFDLGGSETRKLQLYIDSPLQLDPASLGLQSSVASFPGSNALGLDATLNLPMSPSLSLTGDLQRSIEQPQYQSVGSIQCTDGVLRPYSYTASGCRFIDSDLGGIEQNRLDLGAQFNTESTSTAISWFTQGTEASDSGVNRPNLFQSAAPLGADLLTPVRANPLLPAHPLRQPLGYFNAETSGVDLNFQLGVTTDSRGDIQFGLALTRVLDAEFGGLYSNMTPWTNSVAESFNTAQMNVEWNRGAFSTGIQGFYREQVDFLNRDSLGELATFDVHFTWRTPWNADLSVGASNILNAGSEDSVPADTTSTDPFESIYGRIPYVRYKQDL